MEEFESIPDGSGTPVESGKFVLDDDFELLPSEEIELGEYRDQGEYYDLRLSVDGNVVIDEVLDPNERLTIEVLDSETVNVERVFV